MSEGQSYSNMEFMSSLPTSNAWEERLVQNVNPTGLTIEQIELSYGAAYMDSLVKRKQERYNA